MVAAGTGEAEAAEVEAEAAEAEAEAASARPAGTCPRALPQLGRPSPVGRAGGRWAGSRRAKIGPADTRGARARARVGPALPGLGGQRTGGGALRVGRGDTAQ